MDKFDKNRRGAFTQGDFLQEMVPKSPNKRSLKGSFVWN